MDRGGCRWNTTSCSPTGFTADGRLTSSSSAFRSGVCPRVSRTQAWRGRPCQNYCASGTYASVLGTFGGPGNGDYRDELRRVVQVIVGYATHLTLPLASVLLHLDGPCGDAAPYLDILTAGLGVIAQRVMLTTCLIWRESNRCWLVPQLKSAPMKTSGMTRAQYDCPIWPQPDLIRVSRQPCICASR